MSSRSYRQFCGLARALDAVGDRWNLLIVRNLVLGPQSWGDLREHLPGVATNLLAERLRDLEVNGLLSHGDDGYALTDAGRALEPAIFALAAWGEQHSDFRPSKDEAIRLRYFMTSLKGRLAATSARSELALSVDGAPFVVSLGPRPDVVQGGAGTTLITFAELRSVVFSGAKPPPALVPLAKALQPSRSAR